MNGLPEELRPGAVRRWTRSITDEDIARFADASGDRGRHHVERDERGRLMAQGLLTATLPTKIGGDLNYVARTMTFEFLKPVFGGDALACVGTVVSSAVQTARYKVRFSFEVRNQDGELVLTGGTTGQIQR